MVSAFLIFSPKALLLSGSVTLLRMYTASAVERHPTTNRRRSVLLVVIHLLNSEDVRLLNTR